MFFAGFRRKSNEKIAMPALILSNFWYLKLTRHKLSSVVYYNINDLNKKIKN